MTEPRSTRAVSADGLITVTLIDHKVLQRCFEVVDCRIDGSYCEVLHVKEPGQTAEQVLEIWEQERGDG